MLLIDIVHLTPIERDLVIEIARAMLPFEQEIACRWHDLYTHSSTIHQAGDRTVRSFQHAVRLLLTSLEDGNFTSYLKRIQRMSVTFARTKERYENLILFFCFYEESVIPFLRNAFAEKINLILRTLEHLYHGLVAVMSRAYFQELEKDREKFLNTLVHDLRNPLIGMTGFAEMMTKKRLPKEKEEKFLRIIRDSGEKASSLIDHALTYGRLKSGKAFLAVRDVDIMEIVREAATFLLPEIEKRALCITINRKQEKNWKYICPLKAPADRELLMRAVGNYLSNAVKHARERISISVQERKDGVLVSVSDDGPGIPADKLSRVFEDYYVVPGGNAPGIGVGLASVKMIAELCQGKAWAESASGRCIFNFLVPR